MRHSLWAIVAVLVLAVASMAGTVAAMSNADVQFLDGTTANGGPCADITGKTGACFNFTPATGGSLYQVRVNSSGGVTYTKTYHNSYYQLVSFDGRTWTMDFASSGNFWSNTQTADQSKEVIYPDGTQIQIANGGGSRPGQLWRYMPASSSWYDIYVFNDGGKQYVHMLNEVYGEMSNDGLTWQLMNFGQ